MAKPTMTFVILDKNGRDFGQHTTEEGVRGMWERLQVSTVSHYKSHAPYTVVIRTVTDTPLPMAAPAEVAP